MKNKLRCLCLVSSWIPLLNVTALATDGEWNGGEGQWSDPAIWLGGVVPGGPGATATMHNSHVGGKSILLDTDVVLGRLDHENPAGGNLTINYQFPSTNRALTFASGGPLAPVIRSAGGSLAVNTRIIAADGFRKDGDGILRLTRQLTAIDPELSVYQYEWIDNSPSEADGWRRYTTFTETRGGRQVAVINSNPTGHANPGPGWTYLPTGIAWQPDTAYLIDFLALGRTDGGIVLGGNIEYGLWAGLPDLDGGAGGNYNNVLAAGQKPGPAASRPSLGTQGRFIVSQPTANTLVRVSEVSGFSAEDERFVFVTGPDVSGLDEMVVFIRNGNGGLPNPVTNQRLHWTDLEILALPAADFDDFLNPPAIEANEIDGEILLADGFIDVAGDSVVLGEGSTIRVTGTAGFWTNTGGVTDVGQDILLDSGSLEVFGFPGNDRSLRINGAISGSGNVQVTGTTGNLILAGDNDFAGEIIVGPGGMAAGASNHTRVTIGTGPTDPSATPGIATNPVILDGSLTAVMAEGIAAGNGTAALRFRRDDYTFAGDITGNGVVEISLEDLNVTNGSAITLTGSNTYAGITQVRRGALRVNSPNSLSPDSSLQFNQHGVLIIGGDLAPANATADFDWPIGTQAGAVNWANGGGFAAAGADRVVNLGGAGDPIDWESGIGASFSLFLGHPDADATVVLSNSLFINGTGNRVITVPDGLAAIDARLAASTESASPSVGLVKAGAGTLAIAADMEHFGPTLVQGGRLRFEAGASIIGSTDIVVGGGATLDVSGSPGFTLQDFQNLGGTGTITGDLVINGYLMPGAAATPLAAAASGTLETDGLLFDGFDASLFINFDSATGSSSSLKVNGDIDLSGALLAINDVAATPAVMPPGTRIVLIDYSGHSLSGTFTDFNSFSDLPDLASITFGSNTFTLRYNDASNGLTTGNFVTLTIGDFFYQDWALGTGLSGMDFQIDSDPDDDGVANVFEFALGGDPLDADSMVAQIASPAPNEILPGNGEFIVAMTRDGAPYAPGFHWMARAEDKSGYGSGTFQWNDPVTWSSAGGSLGSGTGLSLAGWRSSTSVGAGLLVRNAKPAADWDYLVGTAAQWTGDGGGNNASTFGEAYTGHGFVGLDNHVGSDRYMAQNSGGYAWLPTGLDWEPDTTYVIEMVVAHRAGNTGNGILEYGLWDDVPPGQQAILTTPSLGTTGKFHYGDLPGGGYGNLETLIAGNTENVRFEFTTSDDVSGLGDMHVFLRNVAPGPQQNRIYWAELQISALPADTIRIPEQLNASAAVPVADAAHIATTIDPLQLAGATQYELRFDFELAGLADWLDVRDALIAEIRQGGVVVASLDVGTQPEAAASWVVPITTPAEPVALEIRLGSSGAVIGDAGDLFVFDRVALVPASQSTTLEHIVGFKRRIESLSEVRLSLEYSAAGDFWTTIPIVAGQRGRADITIQPLPGEPDFEQVTVKLPATLALNGGLQIRLRADFRGTGEPVYLPLFESAPAGPPGDAYQTWAAMIGLVPPNDGRFEDKDGDGVANILEWVLGTDPLNPGRSDEGFFAERVGNDFVFTFDRAKDTLGEVNLALEYSENLLGWTSVSVPAATQGLFTVTDAGDFDVVTATIPAAVGGKIFIRLKAE